MKSICFVSATQCGYLIDLVKHAEYFCLNGYSVKIICLDQGRLRLDVGFPGLEIDYVKIKFKYKFIRLAIFSIICTRKFCNKDRVVFYYHPLLFVSYLLSGGSARLFMDVRTGSVAKSRVKRALSNFILRVNSFFFKNVLVIDANLAKYLKINYSAIVPLGADPHLYKNNYIEECRGGRGKVLLYIGTLTGRRLDVFIKGFAAYRERYGDEDVSLYIIGDGLGEELSSLKNLTLKLNIPNCVNFLGRLSHVDAMKYMSMSNYGVAYIPIIDCYQYQPATKIYEYGMAGLPCIATSTIANESLMNNTVGVLIEDNIDSVCEGIRALVSRDFDSVSIKRYFSKYTWASSSAVMESALFHAK